MDTEDAPERTVERSEKALSPRLTLRVGVTGHRPNKLTSSQQRLVQTSAGRILDCLSNAANQVRQANQDVFLELPAVLRLTTSLAEGADTLLADVALEQNYKLDVILPFPRETYTQAQNFTAEAKSKFDEILDNAATLSILELDGHPGNQDSARTAYLSAGRRMLAHCDILLGVWDGDAAEGIGGTAQIMREAVDGGTCVIWIKPDGNAHIVSQRNELVIDVDRLESVFLNEGDCSDRLYDVVRQLLAPPATDTDSGKHLREFLREPARSSSYWSAYNLLKSVLVGHPFKARVRYKPAPETEANWKQFHRRAELIGGEAFAESLRTKLEVRWRQADTVAVHYSHAHRSAYILNYVLAGLAVLTGLISLFWWSASQSVYIKAGFIFIEVLLILMILLLTKWGGKQHGNWHARWLDARTVAELLRSARLLSIIGNSTAPPTELFQQERDGWIDWYVRATIREIGLPSGRLNATSMQLAIESAIEDEIESQIVYNELSRKDYEEIDHKLHVGGEILFTSTLIVGVGFLLLVALYAINSVTHGIYIEQYQKDFGKALVTMLGAGLPAFGAGLFGIRATGDFKLSSERASQTLKQLYAVKAQLQQESINPNRERVSNLFHAVAETLVSDLRTWTRIFRYRELSLPA